MNFSYFKLSFKVEKTCVQSKLNDLRKLSDFFNLNFYASNLKEKSFFLDEKLNLQSSAKSITLKKKRCKIRPRQTSSKLNIQFNTRNFKIWLRSVSNEIGRG